MTTCPTDRPDEKVMLFLDMCKTLGLPKEQTYLTLYMLPSRRMENIVNWAVDIIRKEKRLPRTAELSRRITEETIAEKRLNPKDNKRNNTQV